MTLLRAGVSLALFALLLWQVDLDDTVALFANARLDLLLLLVAVVFANRWLAAYRWFVLLHGRNSTIALGPIVRLTLVSGFVGYLMPGGLGVDVVRYLGAVRGTANRELVVTSLLVERILAVAALALLVLTGLPLLPPVLPPAVGHVTWVILAMLVAVILALLHGRARRLTRHLLPVRRVAWIGKSLDKLYQGLDEYRDQPLLMLHAVALAVAFQLVRCVAVAIGAATLGASLPFMFFVVIAPLVTLLALAPVSIAGLGVQEAGFVYLFGLAGMPVEMAFALALLIRAASIVATLPGAWLYARGGIAP